MEFKRMLANLIGGKFNLENISSKYFKRYNFFINLNTQCYVRLPLKDAVSLGLDVPESILTEINAKASKLSSE